FAPANHIPSRPRALVRAAPTPEVPTSERQSMLTSVNGTTLFTESVGQGRSMLVLHGGLGFDHTYFRPFLDPLAEQTRVVYLDHRMHGRSGRPAIETLTHEQLVADAEA